jgi:hypothetical protein
MRWSQFTTLALLACGGGDTAVDDGLAPGHTSCGDITCAPGQYCFGPNLCENGCTSDINCLDDEECVIDDTFFDEGSCWPMEPRQTTEPVGGLEGCQAACGDFQSCGLSPAEASACYDDCADLTASQQQAVANCGGLSCDATLDCLGIQCFTDDDCNGGRSCVGNSCL